VRTYLIIFPLTLIYQLNHLKCNQRVSGYDDRGIGISAADILLIGLTGRPFSVIILTADPGFEFSDGFIISRLRK
jgi:hypothetical protein